MLSSTASLGQRPDAPTTANDRQEWHEDRIVRKGIEKLHKRHGGEVLDAVDSGGEDEDERAAGGSSTVQAAAASSAGAAPPQTTTASAKQPKAKKSKQVRRTKPKLPCTRTTDVY